MTVLNTILTIVFIILSIVITVIILMQEGKSAGLGAIAGAADTYWGKNKGRSMEGGLIRGRNACKAYKNFCDSVPCHCNGSEFGNLVETRSCRLHRQLFSLYKEKIWVWTQSMNSGKK